MKASTPSKIVVQHLKMQMPSEVNTYNKELLVGEIDNLKIEHIALTDTTKSTIHLSKGCLDMFFFLSGRGMFHANSITHQITPESIAIPMNGTNAIQFEVAKGEELHFLKFTKNMWMDFFLTKAGEEWLKTHQPVSVEKED